MSVVPGGIMVLLGMLIFINVQLGYIMQFAPIFVRPPI